MTLHEAAADFLACHGTQPWLVAVGHDATGIVAYTAFELPQPLQYRLRAWHGWLVYFVAIGRECVP